MSFPFMSHHEWYGFEDAQDLIDFLENGVYPGDNTYVDEEELRMLPPPEDTSNGKTKANALLDHRGKPIVRVRGNTVINIPIKEKEPKVIEQTIKVTPNNDSELIEIITEDIASGGSGG